MTKLEQAARQALDLLDELALADSGSDIKTTITAMREALDQLPDTTKTISEQAKQAEIPEWVDVDDYEEQEQEPVAGILPCPFCGDNKLTVFEGSTFRWRVAVCNNCGAYAPEVRHDTLAEDQKQAGIESDAAAITAWNTRAAPVRTKDLTRDEVEALFWKWKSSTEYPVPLFEFRDIASAVIAADRRKNK